MKKELTICMPVYNGEKYLDESIGSVLGQTYSNFKFLIYDDGSTDGSVEKVKSFNDKRIELIEGKENHGAIYARSRLIEEIDTKYCMWIDADDRFCRNDAFEFSMDCIVKNDYDIVNFAKILELYFDGSKKIKYDGCYDDFSYCGNRFFEKFYPVDNHFQFYSKIFNSDILKHSIPEEEIINRRFYSDDVFFAGMWWYRTKRYLHLFTEEPIYEYKKGIGMCGSLENDFSVKRINGLCELYYSSFISLFNRMNKERKMTNAEYQKFIGGCGIFSIVQLINSSRGFFGNEHADNLKEVFYHFFCKDKIHLLNNIDGFVFPDFIKFIEQRIEQ